jgi:hypothetical protein
MMVMLIIFIVASIIIGLYVFFKIRLANELEARYNQEAEMMLQDQMIKYKDIEYRSNINTLHVLEELNRKRISKEEAEERILNSMKN